MTSLAFRPARAAGPSAYTSLTVTAEPYQAAVQSEDQAGAGPAAALGVARGDVDYGGTDRL